MKRIFLLSLFSLIINLSYGQIEYTIVHGDATICDWSNTKIEIQTDADEISWSPTDSLSCDDCFVLTANPSVTTTYSATLKKKNEGDEFIQITITVKPNDAHFPQGDTLYFCKGDSKQLVLDMENTAGNVQWTSSEGLDSTIMNETQSDTLLTPQDNMVFYATAANTSDCTDSIIIQVDSLPMDRTIKIIDPKMPPYCDGQQFIMKSPNYEQSDFPNMDFFWSPPVLPADGTPDSLYNLVWTAHEAKVYTFTRETTNGACKVTDKIDIPVLKVMDVTIDPSGVSKCIGDTVQINVTAKDDKTHALLSGEMYDWKPKGLDLSCTDCSDPIGTLTGNGSSKVKVTLTGYCPGDATFDAALDMTPVPIDINQASEPCAGGSTELSIVNPESNAQYTWSISNGELLGCTDCTKTKVKIKDSPATITVTASSPDYCVDGTKVFTIAPSVEPVEVSINDVFVSCPGATVNVSVANPMDGINYTWTADNGAVVGCNPCVETAVTTSENAITKLHVTASSTSCQDGMAEKNVTPVEDKTNYLPKVFTPNADGKNDYFNFFSDLDVAADQVVKFEVFNRWGQKVYNNDTPDKGWDGKLNGKDAAQDVYLYQVELGDNFCNKVLKGDVTLLR